MLNAEDYGRVTRLLGSQVRWAVRARPDDYLIAMSAAISRLPGIGRYLEPVGGVTALTMWGARYLPDFAASARARMNPGGSRLREQQREQTESIAQAGLRDVITADALAEPWPAAEKGAPWRHAGRHRKLIHRESVPYGDEPGQVLDVWRREDLAGPAPVLVFVPGGAWVIGSRVLQGHALMAQLAEQGWVCLSVEYRTSPRYRWPRQLRDVEAAIKWARANAHVFGGDREFVAIAGCSAGGHMATLAGLTSASGHAAVDAVVSIYGRYDWEDRSTPERARFMDFLERVVVKRRQQDHPAVFRDASPVAKVHAGAPPFLVIHGDDDTIIPVPEARGFVERLRGVTTNPVAYVELPGAGHGFDLLDDTRTAGAVRAISLFLNHIHRTRPGTPEHVAG